MEIKFGELAICEIAKFKFQWIFSSCRVIPFIGKRKCALICVLNLLREDFNLYYYTTGVLLEQGVKNSLVPRSCPLIKRGGHQLGIRCEKKLYLNLNLKLINNRQTRQATDHSVWVILVLVVLCCRNVYSPGCAPFWTKFSPVYRET